MFCSRDEPVSPSKSQTSDRWTLSQHFANLANTAKRVACFFEFVRGSAFHETSQSPCPLELLLFAEMLGAFVLHCTQSLRVVKVLDPEKGSMWNK